MVDIDKVRRDTPSCESILHFNSAGSSLMPKPVFEALQKVLMDENEVGGYEAERRAKDDGRVANVVEITWQPAPGS